ncbi:MAG: hypothetical protein PHY92_02975 [Alphaproteobacteria bacterium]|nr:hypothetical protein [Alphaproteobacteria bacterium]
MRKLFRQAQRALCVPLLLATLASGCATTSPMSPEAMRQERFAAQAFEAAQADNARNVAHYPWLTDIAPPLFNHNGFEVQVFGQGKGREDLNTLNPFNGVYRSWSAPNDNCAYFSLSLTWNKKGVMQSCSGKIYNNVVYGFRAESSEQDRKTEITNDSNSYLGQSLLQVCTRAAIYAGSFMRRSPFFPRLGY